MRDGIETEEKCQHQNHQQRTNQDQEGRRFQIHTRCRVEKKTGGRGFYGKNFVDERRLPNTDRERRRFDCGIPPLESALPNWRHEIHSDERGHDPESNPR